MRRFLFVSLFIFLLFLKNDYLSAQPTNTILKNKTVLVFTKNGKGYIHENIPSSIAAFQKLGKDHDFEVDTTTDSGIFSDEKMKTYDAVIFSNTNNDVFDTEEQKVAFMRYIQAGGSFMGIHSAAGTERNWNWFKLLLGATFLRHPPFQSFSVQVINKTHPATKKLSTKWETNDECYYFKEINPDVTFLLFSDISNIKEEKNSKNVRPDTFGNRSPAAWCHDFDGGKAWYTALGHSKEDYSNLTYLAHIIEGLKWLVDKNKIDYTKAYATSSVINEMEVF
jgi:type 1 glutamine amidotransferase